MKNYLALAGALAAIIPGALAAQPIVPQTGAERDFPVPTLVAGQPVEARPQENRGRKPLHPWQTRAPYRSSAQVKVTLVTDKLARPWSLAFLPGGDILVTERERPAALRVVKPDGTISTPFTGLEALPSNPALGLLEVALDPEFSKNRTIFLSFFERLDGGYSNTNLARGTLDVKNLKVENLEIIFRGLPAAPVKNFSNKQGGRIAFDRDGTLFMTVGDRDTGTPWKVAQDLSNHLGKLIHLSKNGRPAPNNPFLTTPNARPEIWASGLRSPQGLAADSRGQIWETEHGPRGGDELNLMRRGGNFGWPIISYGIDYPGTPIGEGEAAKEGMEQPVYYWDPVIAPSSLAFYRGNRFPQWKNSAFVGALRGKMLTRLEIKNNKVIAEEPLLIDQQARIRDVKVSPEGAVYVLTEPGQLLRISPR